MKRKLIPILVAILVVAVAFAAVLPVVSNAAEAKVFVADASVTGADIVTAWNSGAYDYIQLAADQEIALDGEQMKIDLAGFDLTATGKGKLYAFDTANDTYDHTKCGTLIAKGVQCASALTAPNGNYYIALGEGRYTFHRLEMKLTSVSLRMSNAGVYYNASFSADRLVRESVDAYGVAVSLVDMPDKNFRTEDLYTVVSGKEMVNGAIVNSGIVQNILKANADDNGARGKMDIYARLYMTIDGKDYLSTTGAKKSLKGLMDQLDKGYSSLSKTVRGQLDNFHNQWKASTAWSFTSIGKVTVDLDTVNQPLQLDADNKAYCPVCKATKTWTLITSEARVTAANGGHYYLASDVEYTESGTAMSYFGAPGTGGWKACLHLNEHNITATNVRAIYGSSGVLNVMGNGIVSGYAGKSNEGAAIHTGNKNVNNGINLYGGTYRKVTGAASGAAVIGTGAGGRIYTVYKGATIDGGTGLAIYADGETTHNGSVIELLGCTVNGNIAMSSQTAKINTIEVIGATVNGTLTAREGHNVTLSGQVKLNKLVVPAGATVNTNTLTTGASIAVDATGYFTEASANLVNYTDFFTAADSSKGVFVRNNKLFCGKDYVSNLSITVDAEGNQMAYCPVCEKTVAWTELNQEVIDAHNPGEKYDYFYTFAKDGHYYLSSDLTYTSDKPTYSFLHLASSGTACLHLNGHNITSTKRTGIYTASSTLNIMGTGTLAGYGKSNSYAAAVHANNKSAVFNFYGGTYTAAEGFSKSGYIIRGATNGARFNFFEDAVVDGSMVDTAIYLTANPASASVLKLQGTTVLGNISANGRSAAGGNAWTLTLDNAVVTGTLTAKNTNNITLLNDVQIGLLDASENSKVDLTDGETDGITIGSGARVTIKNAGTFAHEFEESAAYVSCFTTAWRDDKIVVRNNALTYMPNYEMSLQYNSEGKARCPICQEYYAWTELSASADSVTLAGGHYFLSEDLVYTGTDAAVIGGTADTSSCLHLNGFDITASKGSAIAAGAGTLNVMGVGVVSGVDAVVAESASAGIVNLHSATYRRADAASGKPVVSVGGKGGTIAVYENAVLETTSGTVAYIGDVAEGTGKLVLDRVVLNGDLVIEGAAEAASAVVETYNTAVKGNVVVSGQNDITFAGKTDISGKLRIAEGSLIGLADMVQPDTNIIVEADGIFTEKLTKARAWATFFVSSNAAENWVVARDNAIECSERVTLTTDDSIAEVLDTAYTGLEAKFGEMHNHTSAGLTADGRRTLAQWKERMALLDMSFATIVDHKQVAHMYHKDWQTAPTAEHDVVFVGGSEPGTNITEMMAGTQGNMHYNLLTGDPQKLVDLVIKQEKETGKNFHTEGVPYGDANWGSNGKNNKNKDFIYTDYNEPDGLLDRIYYPSWTRTEFINMVKSFYDAGGLIVEVHPDYPSYIKSSDPLDYCFSGNAGSDTEAAMGFEIHTGNYGYMPSRIYNEQAYQLWLDMLDAGKKVYATYGDDGHRLPTAVAMTTVYAPNGADAAYYMQLMHDGNFAPGWVGIRMMVGDTKMGGTAETFEGQQLIFSIGDMYAANDYSRTYLDKGLKPATMTWEPGYVADQTYTVRVYDDSGLLSECEVNPSTMNYFAIDADASAKFYRIEVWTENADGSIRYRCGVGNPIWNAAAYAPAE